MLADQDQSFEKYLAIKTAAAHGFSETFDEEVSFPTFPSSAASDVSAPVIVVYPRSSGPSSTSGKSYLVRYKDALLNPFEIIPATLVTSRTLSALVAFGQGGSMASQQPPTAEDETVEEIIWRIGATLSVPYRTKLASRLGDLQKAVQDEELDGRGIMAKSLQHFIELLKAYPALKCPIISVTPERNIYASWKAGPNRVFSVHFLPDAKVRFVIFCPNDKHPSETIRLSGTATVDVLIKLAQPYGVLDWVSE